MKRHDHRDLWVGAAFILLLTSFAVYGPDLPPWNKVDSLFGGCVWGCQILYTVRAYRKWEG